MKEPNRAIDTLNRLFEHYSIRELAYELERSFSLVWHWKIGKQEPTIRDWKKLRYLDRQVKLRGE